MEGKDDSIVLSDLELARQRPVLTEAELSNFYTYDEAVEECLGLFDEGIEQLYHEDDVAARRGACGIP